MINIDFTQNGRCVIGYEKFIDVINNKLLHSLGSIWSFSNLRDGLASLDIVDRNLVLSRVVSVTLFQKAGKCRVRL